MNTLNIKTPPLTRESLVSFSLIPKLVTFILNDPEWLFHIKFCFFCACRSITSFLDFRKQLNCVKTNTPHYKQHTQLRDSSFWQYKVYADILGGSLERRHQTTMGSHVNARAVVACTLAQLKFIRCMRNNKSARSLDVGIGRDGRRFT